MGIITAEIATRLKERASVLDSLRSMDDPDAMVRRTKEAIETGATDLFTILIAQMRYRLALDLRREEATAVAMQVLQLWFAAFETTSSSISAAVFEMWRLVSVGHLRRWTRSKKCLCCPTASGKVCVGARRRSPYFGRLRKAERAWLLLRTARC
jgi:hypothetical protein